MKIRLSESLLGFNRVCFVHLDGRGIRIEVKKGERVIRHDEELVIRGEGMPIRGMGRKGDLYVKFSVEMPGESWASRQDVVDGVGDSFTEVKLWADLVEHQSRATGPTARDESTARESRHLFPCTSAEMSAIAVEAVGLVRVAHFSS